jgi:hypothetical protein
MNDNEVVSDKGRNCNVCKVQAETLPSAEIAHACSTDLAVKGFSDPSVCVVKKNCSSKSSLARHLFAFKVLRYISLSNFELARISL